MLDAVIERSFRTIHVQFQSLIGVFTTTHLYWIHSLSINNNNANEHKSSIAFTTFLLLLLHIKGWINEYNNIILGGCVLCPFCRNDFLERPFDWNRMEWNRMNREPPEEPQSIRRNESNRIISVSPRLGVVIWSNLSYVYIL
jgi:hypothetical protein